MKLTKKPTVKLSDPHRHSLTSFALILLHQGLQTIARGPNPAGKLSIWPEKPFSKLQTAD